MSLVPEPKELHGFIISPLNVRQIITVTKFLSDNRFLIEKAQSFFSDEIDEMDVILELIDCGGIEALFRLLALCLDKDDVLEVEFPHAIELIIAVCEVNYDFLMKSVSSVKTLIPSPGDGLTQSTSSSTTDTAVTKKS